MCTRNIVARKITTVVFLCLCMCIFKYAEICVCVFQSMLVHMLKILILHEIVGLQLLGEKVHISDFVSTPLKTYFRHTHWLQEFLWYSPRWIPAFSSTLSLQELLEEQRLHDLELQQLRQEQAAQAAQAREEGSTGHRFQAWEKHRKAPFSVPTTTDYSGLNMAKGFTRQLSLRRLTLGLMKSPWIWSKGKG